MKQLSLSRVGELLHTHSSTGAKIRMGVISLSSSLRQLQRHQRIQIPAHTLYLADHSSHSQPRLQNRISRIEATDSLDENFLGDYTPIGLVPLVWGYLCSYSRKVLWGSIEGNDWRHRKGDTQEFVDVPHDLGGHSDLEVDSMRQKHISTPLSSEKNILRRRVYRTPTKRKVYIELPSDEDVFEK
uniref:Uncharacterized protein n=1 Tax=Percolomonas cosmopolitus TaxID=63605 RepID=A0A7S1KRT1_9EUKA|mmetsp:Transcript_6868/g.25666  ORF Transcript_6868/g.25666 Transcript_6868/m.25666 type:complete len:185 (+) Transcript_6868:69-623(+)